MFIYELYSFNINSLIPKDLPLEKHLPEIFLFFRIYNSIMLKTIAKFNCDNNEKLNYFQQAFHLLLLFR